MSDLFKPVPWSVQNLVAAVESGALRLPDIQRPFVWEKVKVRDLVDSIYRGSFTSAFHVTEQDGVA